MGFLYKELNEKEKKEIENEAKKIIDSFSKKLSKIKDLPSEGVIERKNSTRKEGSCNTHEDEFKEKVFFNAPNKNKDFIIAEKKKW